MLNIKKAECKKLETALSQEQKKRVLAEKNRDTAVDEKKAAQNESKKAVAAKTKAEKEKMKAKTEAAAAAAKRVPGLLNKNETCPTTIVSKLDELTKYMMCQPAHPAGTENADAAKWRGELHRLQSSVALAQHNKTALKFSKDVVLTLTSAVDVKAVSLLCPLLEKLAPVNPVSNSGERGTR